MTQQPFGFVDRRKANGKTPTRDFIAESGGLAVAEFTSMVTSLGVVAVADKIAPNLMKSTTQALSKTLIEPYLDNIEWGLKKICKLEECQPDTTKPREERAEQLAHALVLFAPSFLVSLGAKIATRRGMNNLAGIVEEKIPGQKWWQVWKLSKPERIIIGMDEGVHIGSLVWLNTGAAQITDDLIRNTTAILEKVGISKQKAHELSNMAMIWEVPNALGLMAGTLGVYGKHHWGWGHAKAASHVEKLAQEISNPVQTP